jgi:hypothetical protein
VRRKQLLLGLSVVIALTVGSWPGSAPATSVPRTNVIASRTDSGLKVVLKAERQGDRDAATVLVSAYEKAGDHWRLVGTKMVAGRGAFSWSLLAHPNAVRSLSVSGKDRSATFQVLISRAVGWSNMYLFRLQGSSLVGGAIGCGCAPQN